MPLFFTNPDKVDFNGKLYLLSKEILTKHKAKCVAQGLTSHEVKLCLIFKLLSFVYFSKKIAWANRMVQVILSRIILEQDVKTDNDCET